MNELDGIGQLWHSFIHWGGGQGTVCVAGGNSAEKAKIGLALSMHKGNEGRQSGNCSGERREHSGNHRGPNPKEPITILGQNSPFLAKRRRMWPKSENRNKMVLAIRPASPQSKTGIWSWDPGITGNLPKVGMGLKGGNGPDEPTYYSEVQNW